MKKDNLILIGFMGTGKTTVGKLITERLKWSFVDTDERIVEHTGMTIPSIFKQKGEAWFRDQESIVLEEILKGHAQVVSTGGGAVLRERNRDVMLKGGLVVALTADVDTIVKRVSEDQNRPLLHGDIRRKVEQLMAARKVAYDFAHVKLNTANYTPDELADHIIQYIGQDGKLH